MLDDLQLFRGNDFVINDKLTLHHPTLGEICDVGEADYYTMVYNLCSTSSDFKAFLNDVLHLDFTQVSDYEMFKMVCGQFPKEQTKIIFGDLNFQGLMLARNSGTNEIVLIDPTSSLVIDESIYLLIAEFLRGIHFIERHEDRPGNDFTKKYMIDKARRMQERNKNKEYKSVLVPLVSAMVNSPGFKYDHHNVWEMPIYDFMDSVMRIQKISDYDHVLSGIYAGTIDPKKMSDRESLNWLGALK
jgi:hypothetical protein